MEMKSTFEMAEEHPPVDPNGDKKMCMALRFLERLYGNRASDCFNLWTKQDKRTYSFQIENRREIAIKALSLSEQRMDVYFGVGLHSEKPPIGKRGASEAVTAIPGLWFDMDVKGDGHSKKELPASIDEALKFLKSLDKKPNLVVNTGGGLHAYWVFEKPYQIVDVRDREKCHYISKNFQDSIIARGNDYGWDLDNTADLARILRLPGTLNWKQDTPRPVFVLESYEN